MALRLKGSSSGYAEIDAAAVAGDVTLTLPSTTGTINVKDGSGTTNVGTGVNLGNPGANIFTISNTGGERLRIAADGAVSIPGNLNISGVLTYEDVTSVDAIGLSTFRDGLITKDVGITTISSSDINGGATAVDVFVYDTSKDSDGGAWRKRTSHTSWYNEEAAAGVRGSRKEFPAVAVIVAESNKLTIYDGDDPDLPMWMVFDVKTSAGTIFNMLAGGTGTINAKSVFMLNGILSVALEAPDTTSGGLPVTNFISDSSINYRNLGSSFTGAPYLGNIAQRNDGLGNSPDTNGRAIVAGSCSDVAMTVLPNAPVDSATGLPVPTIAVATNGGVSIIKDDGNVVDITSSKAVNDVDLIHFDKSGRLYFAAQASSSVTDVYQFNRYTIPSSDISNNVYEDNADATYFAYATSGSFANIRPNFNAQYNDGINEDITTILSNNDGGIVGNVNGLSLFVEDYSAQNNGMVAYIASDYNTGYIHGDIKGAFLSDTNTGADFGPEIVTGGDFSDASQWTLGSGWSINGSGQAVHTGGASYIEQAGTFTGGRYYQMTADLISGNAVHFGMTNRNEPGVAQPHNQSTLVDVYCAGGGGKIVAMWQQRSGVNLSTINLYSANNITIDNVSIKEISRFYYDRSVNNKPLALIGSLTKTPVATGADLVAYSGWSTSNYLEQPYNSDLNFGTGDFYVMGWAKPTTNTTGYVWEIAQHQTAANYTEMFYHTSGQFRFYIQGVGNIQGAAPLNIWTHFVCLRQSGVMYMFINGVRQSTTANNTINLNNTSAKLRIGIRAYDVTSPFYGEISLVKTGAGAPSPEQIKKMYDDEKVLFQENAKCTLYGSSDAVTALAYDEVTDQLHVGTSSGRSDFQGLRRINNTTQQVQTAISAHDTFIIEQ